MKNLKNCLKLFKAIAFTVAISANCTSQTWTTGADIPQAFRASNVAAFKNSQTNKGYLFLISGRNSDGNITSRNQRYDLTNNSWSDTGQTHTFFSKLEQ